MNPMWTAACPVCGERLQVRRRFKWTRVYDESLDLFVWARLRTGEFNRSSAAIRLRRHVEDCEEQRQIEQYGTLWPLLEWC